MGYILIFVSIILIFMFEYTNRFSSKKFFEETKPLFGFLMESDYKFLLSMKYGDDIDVDALFTKRLRDGFVTIILFLFIFMMSKINFVNIMLAFIIGFLVFKMPYTNLQKYYRANLSSIDQMLPYYLKGLEILVQHYTVPVALRRSIETAPEIFKSGLQTLVDKIEQGDSSVNPYMDFAKEYPVRDSMRMMRLLYRLGLGSQENKHEQLMMFSRTVSTLQNKAREQKYKARLDKMESQTMMMLVTTGAGILLLLLISMMQMMNI